MRRRSGKIALVDANRLEFIVLPVGRWMLGLFGNLTDIWSLLSTQQEPSQWVAGFRVWPGGVLVDSGDP